jgi:hypothetical protein
MNDFASRVLSLLVARYEDSEASLSSHVTDIEIQPSSWFEDLESKYFDDIKHTEAAFVLDETSEASPMLTKESCRKMLSQSGYREAGWPALALFDRFLVTFVTGKDWVQPSGWANVPPETGCGLVPSLMVCNAAAWAARWINAVKARDERQAAHAACKLAYMMTVIFLACPMPRLREEDQPSAGDLA